jgi:hypothetical protein
MTKLVRAQRAVLGVDPELLPQHGREQGFPRMEQYEHLQRIPRAIGSASTTKRMAPH